MRGPPITIRCECGGQKHVSYGERWTCEQCGRKWNTAQIPADEYWGLLHEMRRMRFVVIGTALSAALLFGLLALFVAQSLFLLLPFFLGVWFFFFMPRWRRKIRLRARSAPTWQLHPE